MRIIGLLAAFYFCLALPAEAVGRTWFVSVDGSDENAGTADEPFRTISRAAMAAGPGETVRVTAGRYAEAVVFPRSGEEGAPIVFEGERGPAGDWLTVLDNSAPVSGWEPAPEVGEGVFKVELGFNPGCITLDGRMLARVNDGHMAREPEDVRGGLNLLSIPADEPLADSERVPSQLRSRHLEDGQLFWDGLEALYGTRDGVTYIRFRGGDDPREKKLLVAPSGAGFVLRDRSHIVVRDFLVRGAQVCVEISGGQATGNLVERNRLAHGRARVVISRGASRNLISGNEMFLEYHGYDRTGAWGNSPLAGYVYRVFKYVVGGNSSDDRAVQVIGAGEGNEISDNLISGGLIGLQVYEAPKLRVFRNIIRNMSSIGIATMPLGGRGPVDAEFFDNLVHDCNINLRLHTYNLARPGERREYYYRNIFHQPGAGINIFVHQVGSGPMEEGYGHPEFFFYHNTFSGGGFTITAAVRLSGGLVNTRFLNNVFSMPRPWYTNREFYDARGMMDVFDYNWVGGELHHGVEPEWLGENNVMATGRRMWEGEATPGFRLPEDSDARGAGLDLSRPFSVQGREFPALPGMEPGYFEGERPDHGAIQHGREILVPCP